MNQYVVDLFERFGYKFDPEADSFKRRESTIEFKFAKSFCFERLCYIHILMTL